MVNKFGDKVYYIISKSGRKIYPPSIRTRTARSCTNDIRECNKWLIKEALLECDNTYQRNAIQGMNYKSLTETDISTLNYVILGEDEPICFPRIGKDGV